MATYRGTSGPDSLTGGAGADELFGFGGNDTLNGAGGADTMDGGGGNDTYIVTFGDVLVDAGGIDTVRSSISWDLAAGFENLIIAGGAATSSQGNNLDNRMVGNDAANYFNARAGDDTLIGNGGDDYFDMSTGGTSSAGHDWIDGGSGIDTVDYDGYALSAVSANLTTGIVTGGDAGGGGSSTILGIERFVGGAYNDTITGNNNWADGSLSTYLDGRGGDDSITGGSGSELILGGAGNDTLYGYVGEDTLDGGAGDDVYIITSKPWYDPTVLRDSGGVDTVVSSYDWTLAPGFERLELRGNSGDGSTGIGNAQANLITSSGWWMYFTLDGAGGNDTLLGGDGADTFTFGAAANYGHDSIDGGARDDTISFLEGARSAVVIDLRAGTATGGGISDSGSVTFANVENANGGDFNDRLIASDGVIHTSRSGVEWFGGHIMMGGDGSDTVTGGAAADTLWGDSWQGGGGHDRVSGGGGNDTIRGGNGNDWLSGGAGNDSMGDTAGDDTLLGGAGDDFFEPASFDAPSYGTDVINGGDGIDTVSVMWSMRSAVTLNLNAGTMSGGGDAGAGQATLISIEKFISGQFDDVLRGKAGAELHGGGGDDVVRSVGGGVLAGDWGNDSLYGSSGADRFLFDSTPHPTNADAVAGFTTGSDRILLDDAAFFAIGATGSFAFGDARFYAAPGATSAHDGDDRVIYNVSTGELYYDSDGTGPGAAVFFATLKGHPALAATDITVA